MPHGAAPRPSKLFYAIALQVGSIIGIGFLGIPFVFQKAGFGLGLVYLLTMGAFVMLTYLLYGEIILRTHYRHQLIGYIYKYLGKPARVIGLVTFWIGVYGAVIGTLIINGTFLSEALSFFGINANPVTLSTIFFAVAGYFVYKGLRTVAIVDFIIVSLVIVIIALFAFFGLPNINTSNFVFSTGNFALLPFGVILYSLYGIQGIPLVRNVLTGHEKKLRKAIIIGMVIPVAVYIIFAIAVVGVAGDAVSPTAIQGLDKFFGRGIVLAGSILGFFTSSTIFLSLMAAFREAMIEDFKFKQRYAFVIALIPALVLFLFGVRNFIRVIGLVGGVSVSLEMILLLFVYIRAKHSGERVPEYSVRIPVPVIYLMMLLFVLGAVYTLIS